MAKDTFYKETDNNPLFPEIEENILKNWKENNTFHKSIAQRENAQEWVFYDGPPFANGLPHYGHLLTSCVKDLYARYQTMKGKKVERRFGWDCHGLPAEMEAEKELKVSGRAAIEKFGIDNFNDHCRSSVMKYTDVWQDYINRAGRWVDFENDYKTMDKSYMESVIWAFSELYKKGLIYESHRVMPYSWAAQTPLSNFETRMDDAYRDREDKAITVAFELEEKPKFAPEGCDKYYILAWTTTPWTLPSNLALGVGKDLDYVCVEKISDKAFSCKQRNTQEVTSPLIGISQSPPPLISISQSPSPLIGISQSPPPLAGGVGGGKKASTRNKAAIVKAKNLRVNQTNAEQELWNILRNKQVNDLKFRRQQPIGDYIVDFVCNDKKLIIELDGGQHSEQKEYDAKRTEFLEEQGYKVIRFWNNEVLENIEGVYDNIVNELDTPTQPSPASGGGLKECYIIERNALYSYGNEFEKKCENSIIKGSSLIGLSYKPLFPYFADTPNAFKILDADFIEEGSGTGIVHLAPGFGEDDQRVCADNNIGVICPVDEAGCYTEAIFDINPLEMELKPSPASGGGLSLKGLNVIADKNKSEDEPYTEKQLERYGLANLRIIHYLKSTGQLIKQEDYTHSYPHCWRTDTPLIYKAVPSWYVEVTKFKDRMVELNQNINWIPDHIKDGQFGKWLEGARDWSISRNRYWGCPIPIWKTPSGKIKVFGSIAKMEDFFGVEITDLHRPFIDTLTKEVDGEMYTRVTDVFDCWFESGSMPYAQVHYPFENKKHFEENFPADFIVEYVGQTRGWFYTLMVLSTALFDREPFKNCICHGVILGEPTLDKATGKMRKQKLSKRLKNYPDPNEMFDVYGADAMRWRMISEPVMHGGELVISKDGSDFKDVVRLTIKPIWNAYHFFTLYANTDGIKARLCVDSDNLMDRYILGKLKHSIMIIEKSMDSFDTPAACSEVEAFFEVLNNWYIRRNRDRFWREANEEDTDKYAAYNTLYTCLNKICRAASPLLPLITEEIYNGLTNGESIHLAEYPETNHIADEAALIRDMDHVRNVCNAALSIRDKENIRTRQPLQTLTIYSSAESNLEIEDFADLIADEINVKEVAFSNNLDSIASPKLQLNFPVAGKRLGKKMKEIATASKQGNWEQKDNGNVFIAGEKMENNEYSIQLEAKGIKGAQAVSTNDAMVALDLEISDKLKKEGIARDVIRGIQQARREADLHVADRIKLFVKGDENIIEAINNNIDYIKQQTLSNSLEYNSNKNHRHNTVLEFDTKKISIGFDIAI